MNSRSYVSGKSSILMEKMGLIQTGTVNTGKNCTWLLFRIDTVLISLDYMINSKDGTAYGSGCFSNNNFLNHAMCFYLYQDKYHCLPHTHFYMTVIRYGRIPTNIDSTYILNITRDTALQMQIQLDTLPPFNLQQIDPSSFTSSAWNVTNLVFFTLHYFRSWQFLIGNNPSGSYKNCWGRDNHI